MKKLLLLLCISLAIISCGKKEDNNIDNNQKNTKITNEVELDGVSTKEVETQTVYENKSDEPLEDKELKLGDDESKQPFSVGEISQPSDLVQ